MFVAKITRALLTAMGLRVSGKHEFHVSLKATAQPDQLPDCDLGIVATKATQVEDSMALVGNRFNQGAVISAQNGLGSEEIIAAHTRGQVIRGTTFMSGTKHSDTHVQYELDTATWIGPFEPRHTAYALVKEAADLDQSGRPEGRGTAGCASGPMVEADLQCVGQRSVRANRIAAFAALRG